VALTLRYDETYHFYRPPRAHHCHDADAVVEQFDHFCPFLGSTIGVRNYRPFVSFLLAVPALLVATTGFCAALIAQESRRRGEREALFDALRRIYMAPILTSSMLTAPITST